MDATAPLPLSVFEPRSSAPGRDAKPPHPPRTVELVRVANAREARAVFDHLSHHPASISTVPVSAPLAARLRRIGVDLGYRVGTVAARDLLARQCPAQQRAVSHAPAVVALPRVRPERIALAEHVSGRAAIRDVERDPLPPPGAPALVLIDRDTPADAVWRAFAVLAARGSPFGALPVDGGASGRLALLKALLFPAIDAAEIAHGDALRTLPAGTPAAKRGILIVAGHGNAVDLGGDGIVVCPRGDRAPTRMAGLYPCFGDGRCFRQPLFGRAPEQREGLIDPAGARHALVLLLGCATFALGTIPFARRGTILWRLAESDALAAVATIGAFYHDRHVETALLALLLEGHPLGEAVRRFNVWHRAAHGPTSPAGEAFGPLIAVGNPAFRIAPGRIRDTADFQPDADGGTEIIRIDAGADGVLLSASAPSAAVRIAGPKGSASYVAIRAGAAPASFELRPFDRQGRLAERAMLRDALPSLGLWRQLIGDAAGPLMRALGEDAAPIAAEIDVLGTERLLRAYLASRAFECGAVIPTEAMLAAHRLAIARWRRAQAAMLAAASLYVARTGGFLLHLWQQYYARDAADATQACPGCGRETVPLSYAAPGDAYDRHRVIHCPACGVLGQLPFGVTTLPMRPIRPRRGGETLALKVVLASDRAAPLHGEFLLLRESWFHSGEDAAPSGPVTIAAGARTPLSFALPLARGLAPGLYPLTLLGVANGAPVQLRRHISILEPAS